MAYKIYKELERILKEKLAMISPEQAIDIAKTIYSVSIKDPISNNTIKETLLLNEEQKYLDELFDF